ncbi:hypothetical protein [Bradyrhizobium retamae]|uniref:Uncharacterized protein n=1 Tax=Bradyrhizobium retamae TaxID=1300035 RepID=A0A0R3MJB2_9BRAD|nr:hypothetical protein [Bradyrhizobium retamae]KRR17565.1 hypothetical protein CQ13_36170 [Bradyrhizobium retamae]
MELVSDIPEANKASEASAEESEKTWQTRAVFAARKRRAFGILGGSQVLSLETALSAAAQANIASAAPNAKDSVAEARAPIRLRSIVPLVDIRLRNAKTASAAPQLIISERKRNRDRIEGCLSDKAAKSAVVKGALNIFAVRAVMPFSIFYHCSRPECSSSAICLFGIVH